MSFRLVLKQKKIPAISILKCPKKRNNEKPLETFSLKHQNKKTSEEAPAKHKIMQDPFNPGTAIGKIVLTGPAPNRGKVAAGEYLPMEEASGYMIRAAQRRVLGRHKDAIDDYNSALALEPSNALAQFSKGLTYVGWEKKEEAIASFEAAIVLFEKADIDRSEAARLWLKRLRATH